LKKNAPPIVGQRGLFLDGTERFGCILVIVSRGFGHTFLLYSPKAELQRADW
jgi:hypothetical protein